MAEDAEAAGEERGALAVALDVLGGEEADERLGDGESHAGTSASWSRVGMSSAHASLEAT